jgi:acyl-CoA thioester hydrolase
LDPITYKGCVYPWQCDQVGHMNTMWYVGKFDEANWNHVARVGLTPSYLRAEERGRAAVITYKREFLAGEITRCLRPKREVAAICEITALHIDRRARKTVTLPPAVRDAAAATLTPAAT